MSKDVTAESGPSYEMVLEAVQESRRGRWFLEEFKARNCQQDTRQILGAIAKLESRIEALPPGQGETAELARVRQAIAATRQEILKAPGATLLSEEGRLFARLADLARKATTQLAEATGNAGIPDGIVQALRLVDQLDNSLNRNAPMAEKYFKRDSELFEVQAAPAKPVLVAAEAPAPAIVETAPPPEPASAKPVVETLALGARLVISRSMSSAEQQVAEAATPLLAPPAAEAPIAPKANMPEPAEGHPRIVIIRRKPDDMPAPVADLQQTEHAA